MRFRRFTALVLAALVLALVLAPQTASAKTSRTVTLTATPIYPVLGSVVRLTGVASRSPIGTVVLFETKSGKKWVRFTTSRTVSRTGTFSTAYTARTIGTQYFRARVLSTKTLAAATSPVRGVATQRRTTATIAASTPSVPAGVPVTLSGRQTPFVSGTTVVLQRKSGTSWVTDGASTRVTSAGRFAFTRKPGVGTSTWRAVASRASSGYYAGATTPAVTVTAVPPAPEEPEETTSTFGDLMQPMDTELLPASVATVTFSAEAPEWFANNRHIRWDTPAAFSHSLEPAPFGSLLSAVLNADHADSSIGAEYTAGSPSLRNADVSFRVTGKVFAIRYFTFQKSEAMVWIDGKPAAQHPFASTSSNSGGNRNWLIVTRTTDEPAVVRFAGPTVFTGVDFDASTDVTVSAVDQFTLGIVGDSMYEMLPVIDPMTQSAAPLLSTLTGFRVWNLAESGTGYLNDGVAGRQGNGWGFGQYRTSHFGSERHIAAVASAPIDALLVHGSINDRFWSATDHRQELDAFLTRVAQVRPKLPVLLVSLEPIAVKGVDDQSDALLRALNANFSVVAEQHSNVVGVIDPFTADWLTGTGHAGQPTGDGNQDVYISSDGIHPNAAGQDYYQRRIVEELRPLRAQLP